MSVDRDYNIPFFIQPIKKLFCEKFLPRFFQKAGEVKGEEPLAPSAEGEIPLNGWKPQKTPWQDNVFRV